MKKLILTIAIVLGLGLTSFAEGGGLFQRGNTPEQKSNRNDTPLLPSHGTPSNADADAPLGTGIALLAVLGGAYLVGKKRKEE